LLRELRRSGTAFNRCEVELSRNNMDTELFTVYIALCSDKSYYVGVTSNLSERIIRHNKGGIVYTRSRLPINIITTIVFTDRLMAYNFEKYLKTGSGRAFMYKRLVKRLNR